MTERIAPLASARATLAGFGAICLWAVLALMTVGTGDVPPFLLTAICFAVATLVGAVDMAVRRVPLSVLRQPWAVWALGVAGLFGYHVLYFVALQNAPPAQASLIAYLWPLLIVLFAALLPGERLRWFHLAGALMGLGGLFVLVGGQLTFAGIGWGYAAALACAFVWSSYSVGSRAFGQVPTAVVTGYCAATAVLSALLHLATEETVWPASPLAWACAVGLGLGPVGTAFYLWDFAMKRGRIQLLGVASYATPVLSILVLVTVGLAAPTWELALATFLVTAGALVAASDVLRGRSG